MPAPWGDRTRSALEVLPFTIMIELREGGRVGLVYGYGGLTHPTDDFRWDDLYSIASWANSVTISTSAARPADPARRASPKIRAARMVRLPPSTKVTILTVSERRRRERLDVRLARRARTIANLARVISERKVRRGICHTL